MRWRRRGFGHRWSSWGEMRDEDCNGLARRSASQSADEGHRFIAGGAERWGQEPGQRFPIQQGQHPLPLGDGGGDQEAEVANPLQAYLVWTGLFEGAHLIRFPELFTTEGSEPGAARSPRL